VKNVTIEAGTLKNLLEVIDDVGYWMSHQEDEEAQALLTRLRVVKHAIEDQAKEHDNRPHAG
jgi:hypothetical protein